MKLDALVSPTDLRDFAKARGWTLVAEGLKDRLYVMSHPDFAKRQLVFPIDITAPDYAEAVGIALEKLGGIESRLPEAFLNSVLEVRDDAMAFRVTTPQPSDRSIPLPFAGAMLVGVEQMLKASACTVLRPQVHHPRLGRSEALQLVEAAMRCGDPAGNRARHTIVADLERAGRRAQEPSGPSIITWRYSISKISSRAARRPRRSW